MNAELLNELMQMKRRDLEVRARLVDEGRLYSEYAEEMQQVHIENAHRLGDLVRQSLTCRSHQLHRHGRKQECSRFLASASVEGIARSVADYLVRPCQFRHELIGVIGFTVAMRTLPLR